MHSVLFFGLLTLLTSASHICINLAKSRPGSNPRLLAGEVGQLFSEHPSWPPALLQLLVPYPGPLAHMVTLLLQLLQKARGQTIPHSLPPAWFQIYFWMFGSALLFVNRLELASGVFWCLGLGPLVCSKALLSFESRLMLYLEVHFCL